MLGSPVTQSAVVLIVTVVAVVGWGDRDDRVIVTIVEVFRGRRLVVVGIAVADAYETAGFCRIAGPAVVGQCRVRQTGREKSCTLPATW